MRRLLFQCAKVARDPTTHHETAPSSKATLGSLLFLVFPYLVDNIPTRRVGLGPRFQGKERLKGFLFGARSLRSVSTCCL